MFVCVCVCECVSVGVHECRGQKMTSGVSQIEPHLFVYSLIFFFLFEIESLSGCGAEWFSSLADQRVVAIL